MATVNGKPLWCWQPSQRDGYFVQVVTAAKGLLAPFTYSGENTLVGRDVEDDTVLGVLKVNEPHASQQAVLDQVVSMTDVLVESSKRRGRKLH